MQVLCRDLPTGIVFTFAATNHSFHARIQNREVTRSCSCDHGALGVTERDAEWQISAGDLETRGECHQKTNISKEKLEHAPGRQRPEPPCGVTALPRAPPAAGGQTPLLLPQGAGAPGRAQQDRPPCSSWDSQSHPDFQDEELHTSDSLTGRRSATREGCNVWIPGEPNRSCLPQRRPRGANTSEIRKGLWS
ncbi:hypothetical protein AV530_000171 [Patagioenas fasciata monilis]|uniref:Uncharacterized protein n=1 Tax=Patagioenas fasciata monilis TaxID=372326 RepID=A0A1V4K9G0_PATFA|nr:hypothetical protein AV530_000171 [Patagioenas fasciata monilis]